MSAQQIAVMYSGFAQLLMHCFLGAMIEHSVGLISICVWGPIFIDVLLCLQSAKICDAITNFDWHLLPEQQQKLYFIFLPRAQQDDVLYIAKVWPLDMDRFVTVRSHFYYLHLRIVALILYIFYELYLQITKSIYSYAMILREMLV